MPNPTNTPELSPGQISRRDFLEILAWVFGIGAIGGSLGSLGIIKLLSTQQKPSLELLPTLADDPSQRYPFSGEIIAYQSETQTIIDQAEKDFGVKIMSPKTWTENGIENQNLPWGVRDIACVALAISQLPPRYLSSEAVKEVLLFRAPNSQNEGAGGFSEFQYRRIRLVTSGIFSPETEFMGETPKRLYRTFGNHLRATIAHEWTHSFNAVHPDMIVRWAQKTGWTQSPNGQWANSHPNELIHDSGADVSPVEDMPVSAGVMLISPDKLDTNRRNFFLTNPFYSNWPTVLDYLSSHH